MDKDYLEKFYQALQKQWNQKARVELTMKIVIHGIPQLIACQQSFHDNLLSPLVEGCEKVKDSYSEIGIRMEYSTDSEVIVEDNKGESYERQ